jgi:hypothetical protein
MPKEERIHAGLYIDSALRYELHLYDLVVLNLITDNIVKKIVCSESNECILL